MKPDETNDFGAPGGHAASFDAEASTRMLRPEHLYKAIGLFFLFLVFYRYFGEISRVFLIVYAAAILAVALNILVGLVPQHRRIVSVALGLLIFGGIGATLWFAIPALARQLRGLVGETLPRFEEQLEAWSEWLLERTGLNIDLMGEQTRGFVGQSFADAEMLGTAWGAVEGIFFPLVILIGGLYAVAKPNERLLSPILKAVPRQRRDAFRHLLELLGTRLRGWVKGTLIAMLAVGALTTLGLWGLGVPYPLLLGLISGLLEFIPLVGPWVAGGIAVAVAVVDDPGRAMWVALLMLAIQQIESNLITPLVMSAAVEVHPFVTLFALFFFGSLFGFLGILLALPLVLLVWTVLEVLWVERGIEAKQDYIEPLVQE